MFYGYNNSECIDAINNIYSGINNPIDLYNALSGIWCEYTCTPNLRGRWSKNNKTLGQCSITSFLAQDIFGGKVFGILRPGGNFHCYNVVGEYVFDLTSEQFYGEELNYSHNPEQLRTLHFAREEKLKRYEYLKYELNRRRLTS